MRGKEFGWAASRRPFLNLTPWFEVSTLKIERFLKAIDTRELLLDLLLRLCH